MSQEEMVLEEIYRAIINAIEAKLYKIGSVIDADAGREMMRPNRYGGKYIYDKGDFYNNAGYLVNMERDGMTLRVGSNVAHEPYVLGGKVPSWTPIAPLKAWVERKGLAWVDKGGKPLTTMQMAFMIQAKIKAIGIEARNVYATVIQNREEWIEKELNSIEVRL